MWNNNFFFTDLEKIIYQRNLRKNIPELKIASQYKTTEQLDKGIASLSDDEIAKYLEKNGNIMDEENISKNMDTTGLPSPEDYLIDENALNNYLNDVNAGSNKNTE